MLLTVVWILVVGAYSVAVPLFLAPDELAHADLVIGLADDSDYPAYDGRRLSVAVKRAAIPTFRQGSREPDLAAGDAQPKGERGTVDELGGSAGDPGGLFNQQPQHPPLYYEAMALVLRIERALWPGDEPPALVVEVAVLRLVNVALVAGLPLAAWFTVARLGGSGRQGLVATVLVLTIPQLAHIGSTVNNDNLLIALGAALAVVLAGVARGDRSWKTVAIVAVLSGAALLTKAFAFFFLPWVGLAYVVAASRSAGSRQLGARWRAVVSRGERRTFLAGVAALGGSVLVGGWWWIGNLVREGMLAPSLESTLVATRPGFEPDAAFFVKRFAAFFPERFWGWFGLYSSRLPLLVIVLATAALTVAVLTGALARGNRICRSDVWLGLVPAVLIGTFVLQHAWSLYSRSGTTPFIQGRYLFPAIIGIVVAATAGVDRWTGRWGPIGILGVAIVMHVVAFMTILDDFWGAPGEGLGDELRALSAWSAWPGAVLLIGGVAGGLALVAGLGVTARDLVNDARIEPTDDQ
jgi:small subunit ribosomal protein S36